MIIQLELESMSIHTSILFSILITHIIKTHNTVMIRVLLLLYLWYYTIYTHFKTKIIFDENYAIERYTILYNDVMLR